MIVTSMKAIVDNRKRKLAEKEASSVRNSKTLKNSNGESSLSKEKEIIRFYYHQIPGSTEEDDIMENEEVIPPPNPIEFDDTKVLK